MYSRKGRVYNRRAKKTVSTRVASKIIAAATGGTVRGLVSRAGFRTGGWRNPSRGAELKYIDTSPATTVFALAGTGTLTLLNGCIQGSDATNRVGRKINMVSITLKAFLRFNTATTASGSGAGGRLMVVYDSQANAAAPAATDILVTDAAYGLNNLNNRERFRVLIDKLFVFDNYAYASKAFNMFRRLKEDSVFNSGNAGTIGDITRGSLYLVTWLDNGYATAAPLFDCRVRIRFWDA